MAAGQSLRTSQAGQNSRPDMRACSQFLHKPHGGECALTGLARQRGHNFLGLPPHLTPVPAHRGPLSRSRQGFNQSFQIFARCSVTTNKTQAFYPEFFQIVTTVVSIRAFFGSTAGTHRNLILATGGRAPLSHPWSPEKSQKGVWPAAPPTW